MEHIPYLMTNIEILPDGIIKFTDTIVVVANGKKLRNGLTKILPRDIVSRNSESHPIDYTLIDVSVNEQSIPYKFVDLAFYPDFNSGFFALLEIIIDPSRKPLSHNLIQTYIMFYIPDYSNHAICLRKQRKYHRGEMEGEKTL